MMMGRQYLGGRFSANVFSLRRSPKWKAEAGERIIGLRWAALKVMLEIQGQFTAN